MRLTPAAACGVFWSFTSRACEHQDGDPQDRFEVETGRLAQLKAREARLEEFAGTMVTDKSMIDTM